MKRASNFVFGLAAVVLIAAVLYSIAVGLVELAFTAFAAWIAGRALAQGWKPMWTCVPYMALLGLADLFMVWAIADNFGGELPGWALTVGGWLGAGEKAAPWLGFVIGRYVVDTAILIGVALVAFRLTQVRSMVKQYPWIYCSEGPFAWRERAR
jgi:branched-chain amino acid transport system ATP-binding protein